MAVVNDERINLPFEFRRVFDDQGDVSLLRRRLRELWRLAPHADHFATGKLSVAVENLPVLNGVRVFRADDADADRFGRLRRTVGTRC